MRTLRNSARFLSSVLAIVFAATLLVACASSNNDSQWKSDDGGYGGVGKFNPVGSNDSGDQWDSAGSNY